MEYQFVDASQVAEEADSITGNLKYGYYSIFLNDGNNLIFPVNENLAVVGMLDNHYGIVVPMSEFAQMCLLSIDVASENLDEIQLKDLFEQRTRAEMQLEFDIEEE